MLIPLGKRAILVFYDDCGGIYWIDAYQFTDDYSDDFVFIYVDDYLDDMQLNNYLNWRFVNNEVFL